MITNKKPVQTCDIDRHKVHETLIKMIPLSTKTLYILIPICIKKQSKFPCKNKIIKSTGKNKKFPERE